MAVECFNKFHLVPGMRPLVSWPRSQAGFVLPLALTASVVLLLGSASIHTLSLQQRLRVQASSDRDQGADQLRSAAQAFAAVARGPEACLLLRAKIDWERLGQSCADADPFRLNRGLVGTTHWSLLDWMPSTNWGRLSLQLADGRTGIFRLALDPVVPAVIGVSDVQLAARSPQVEMGR